ncbi:hypothetical protein [Marinospirillum sp.]|uniref:hypothetical protein n=1 Tax=Marinospirillum sp. TaxID=2183934 RepID=UPI0028709E41|nr:hypothetical protein [Marinospirillum sp.]MDR9467908.1 hypothetical protein [Marinospirillum sp.]
MNTFKKAAQKRLKQQSSSLKNTNTTNEPSDQLSQEALADLNAVIAELEDQNLTSDDRKLLLQKMEALQAKQFQILQRQLPPGPYH